LKTATMLNIFFENIFLGGDSLINRKFEGNLFETDFLFLFLFFLQCT